MNNRQKHSVTTPRQLKDGINYIGKSTEILRFSPQGKFRSVQGGYFDGEKFTMALTHIDENKVETAVYIVMTPSGEILRISDELPVDHANNLTYNSKRGLFLASHCQSKNDRSRYSAYSFIDPKTLTVVESGVLCYPFFSMAYSPELDRYASAEWAGQFVDTWDGNLNPLVHAPASVDHESTSQGVFCDDKYIYFVRSGGIKGANRILIYDWEGSFIRRVLLDIPSDIEPESINIYDGKTYIVCNTAAGSAGIIYTLSFDEE